MAESKGANYKGVMLCNRPSFDANIIRDKPFVSRVDKKENLGINPIKKIHVNKPRKYINTAILKHRIWLDEFKQQVKDEKEQGTFRASLKKNSKKNQDSLANLSFEEEKEKVEKYFKENPPAESEKNNEKELEENHIDESKPLEDPECQELINFMSNLNYEDFIKDMEVKSIINSLKTKIEEKKSMNSSKVPPKVVVVDAEKTTEIKPKNNLPVEDWDKSQYGDKQAANNETKLAKYIAGEILKSSKLLGKIHSNASVRKLLEFEKKNKDEKES